MYHPTSRVLAVLELLQSHKRMTGAELAERLEVNIRTLRRYITTLQDIGIPILAERGRYGAYTLGVGFHLPPMMFTNDEALALEVGLLAVTQLSLVDRGAAVESARAKLENVMPLDLQSRARAVSESIRLDLNANQTTAPSELMLVLTQAVQHTRQIHLRYQSSDQRETERDVDPYGIACRWGQWYVVGWCHLREDLRSFRLDRVLDAYTTDAVFQRPEHFDALAHIEKSIATLPRQHTYEVLLKSDVVRAQKTACATLGLLETHPDGVMLRGSADDIEWVARQLASLPFGFVIHAPDELRIALKKHAAELIALVETSETVNS
ncbi:MAG: YafY family transcriptional regulator [Chloroflexi bacterium]|nr:YafY family transcriptional regulator [Chloroflexota bacterium]